MEWIQLMRQLAPDIMDEAARRALVLERIADMAPVGRRQLAVRLMLPEREVRAAAAALREQGLIALDASGMTVTPKGEEILPEVRALSRSVRGLTELEARLSAAYGVERVCIAPGNADSDGHVLQDVGRLAASRVRAMLRSGDTLAVTGGSTMAATARAMQSAAPLNVMVVPARGGMGRSVETQANTLAAEIAQRLGGHHRLLHLPDHMDEAARQEMLKLPEVRETIDRLQRADVILHGVGLADDTARERELPASLARRLRDEGAVAESLGYYYDADGRALLASSSVGIDLEGLRPSCRMVAVAAGARKAQAIAAVMRSRPHALLVTDEGAAQEMLRMASNP